MLEAMPDGVVIVGADGRIVLVNERTESLSGYSRADLVGMRVEELVPEGLRDVHVDHRAEFTGSPAVRTMGPDREVRFRRRDGSEFPADISLSPVSIGDTPMVVASVRDVTARKQAETERQREQALMRLVADNVRDYAVFMLDVDANVIFWSPGAERILGYSREQVIGRHVSMFYLPAEVAAGSPARELAEAVATKRFIGEGWRVRADRSRFWGGYVITALLNETGQLNGFAMMTRDITDRKHHEDRIRAALEVAQATLKGHDETALLQLISDRARALVEADLATVAVIDPETGVMVIRAGSGLQSVANEG